MNTYKYIKTSAMHDILLTCLYMRSIYYVNSRLWFKQYNKQQTRTANLNTQISKHVYTQQKWRTNPFMLASQRTSNLRLWEEFVPNQSIFPHVRTHTNWLSILHPSYLFFKSTGSTGEKHLCYYSHVALAYPLPMPTPALVTYI
jgi:hypothetical protein